MVSIMVLKNMKLHDNGVMDQSVVRLLHQFRIILTSPQDQTSSLLEKVMASQHFRYAQSRNAFTSKELLKLRITHYGHRVQRILQAHKQSCRNLECCQGLRLQFGTVINQCLKHIQTQIKLLLKN